jgi:hypothetical protein
VLTHITLWELTPYRLNRQTRDQTLADLVPTASRVSQDRQETLEKAEVEGF